MLALALNSLKRLRTFFKSIFFVPAMIGGVTIALIWDVLFYRVVPLIGQALGIEWLSQSVLMSTTTALPAVVFVHAWQAVAMPTVIFIAGMQQIPDEQYESAKIDGANAFERFRYVTMPYLLPTLAVNLVLQIKAGFTSFDFPFALTGGGPARATQVIGILIYKDAFANMRFAVANAESFILFLFMAVFSLIQLNFNIADDAGCMRDGGIFEYSMLHDMTIQAWSPFQYGMFRGTFIGNEQFAALNAVLDRLAEKYNTTPNGIAVAWILRHPGKVQAIVGTTNRSRIASIAQAAEVTLTREEWYELYLSAGKRLP